MGSLYIPWPSYSSSSLCSLATVLLWVGNLPSLVSGCFQLVRGCTAKRISGRRHGLRIVQIISSLQHVFAT